MSPVRLSRDTTTGNTHRRHFMDPQTGLYRGKQIIDVAGKQAKRDKKQQTREEVAKIAESSETEEKGKTDKKEDK